MCELDRTDHILATDKLLVVDDETLNQYNAKLANVQQLAKDYEAARKQLATRQSEVEKSIGISFADLDAPAKR
jgi:hypothetical protein